MTLNPGHRAGAGMGPFEDSFDLSISEIEGISSEAELRAFLRSLLLRYNVKHCVYHAVALPQVDRPNPVLLLTYPGEWVERYVGENYFAIDPVVAAGATSLLPIDWSFLDKRGPGAKRVFGEASELGVGTHGLTFPIRGATGDHALFTITSDAGDAEWKRLKNIYLRDFQVLGHFIHGKVLEFEHGVSAPIKQLSSRERECLNWAARGKTNKEIGRQLGISERVVRAYFESARHKLNCLNRGHVLARAVSLRIIGPAAD